MSRKGLCQFTLLYNNIKSSHWEITTLAGNRELGNFYHIPDCVIPSTGLWKHKSVFWTQWEELSGRRWHDITGVCYTQITGTVLATEEPNSNWVSTNAAEM